MTGRSHSVPRQVARKALEPWGEGGEQKDDLKAPRPKKWEEDKSTAMNCVHVSQMKNE